MRAVAAPAVPDWAALAQKRTMTVAVVDSGLGGLSVMADLAARLKAGREVGSGHDVRLVFFNALFAADSGYNSLRTRGEKVAAFDAALAGLMQRVQPDLVVIACNTLSVLFPDTALAQEGRVPVLEIVVPAIVMMRREMRQHPDAVLVLFGTETTISEDKHRAAVLAAGVPPERVRTKACPELAAYIEKDWRGEETRLLQAGFVAEAVAGLEGKPVMAGLVCTHYGYALDGWREALRESGVVAQGILDPNAELVRAVCRSLPEVGREQNRVTATVLTRVPIPTTTRTALGTWLRAVAPEVAEALATAVVQPDLFKGPTDRRGS